MSHELTRLRPSVAFGVALVSGSVPRTAPAREGARAPGRAAARFARNRFVIASVLAHYVLREHVTWLRSAGAVLVVCGVALVFL